MPVKYNSHLMNKLHPSWYSTCVANGGQILYHQQEGDKPTSEGWYDHRKNTSDVILSVYALEECIYNL